MVSTSVNLVKQIFIFKQEIKTKISGVFLTFEQRKRKKSLNSSSGHYVNNVTLVNNINKRNFVNPTARNHYLVATGSNVPSATVRLRHPVGRRHTLEPPSKYTNQSINLVGIPLNPHLNTPINQSINLAGIHLNPHLNTPINQ